MERNLSLSPSLLENFQKQKEDNNKRKLVWFGLIWCFFFFKVKYKNQAEIWLMLLSKLINYSRNTMSQYFTTNSKQQVVTVVVLKTEPNRPIQLKIEHQSSPVIKKSKINEKARKTVNDQFNRETRKPIQLNRFC